MRPNFQSLVYDTKEGQWDEVFDYFYLECKYLQVLGAIENLHS